MTNEEYKELLWQINFEFKYLHDMNSITHEELDIAYTSLTNKLAELKDEKEGA